MQNLVLTEMERDKYMYFYSINNFRLTNFEIRDTVFNVTQDYDTVLISSVSNSKV